MWYKVRKDGEPDARGVGVYFHKVMELPLFGVRSRLRTAPPGRMLVNLFSTGKQQPSRKTEAPDAINEQCRPSPSNANLPRSRDQRLNAPTAIA